MYFNLGVFHTDKFREHVERATDRLIAKAGVAKRVFICVNMHASDTDTMWSHHTHTHALPDKQSRARELHVTTNPFVHASSVSVGPRRLVVGA